MMTKNLREFAVQGSALQYLLENTQGGPDGNISTSYTNKLSRETHRETGQSKNHNKIKGSYTHG